MNTSAKQIYARSHPFAKVAVYLGGNYAFIFLAQFMGPWGELPVNVLLCCLVVLYTRLLLRLEGRTLADVGWKPMMEKHWKQLLLGTLMGAVMLLSTAFIIKWQTGFQWVLTSMAFKSILVTGITVFASAYVQELAFRGYPFQLLLEKYGLLTAQSVIALLFGCMHLDSGMSLQDVLSTMFTTGIGSMLFGLAYIKTRNLALPVGIHFGWNFLQLLLPRHPGQNGHGIVRIADGSFDMSKLNIYTWILPYAVIIVITSAAIYFYGRAGQNTVPSKPRDQWVPFD